MNLVFSHEILLVQPARFDGPASQAGKFMGRPSRGQLEQEDRGDREARIQTSRPSCSKLLKLRERRRSGPTAYTKKAAGLSGGLRLKLWDSGLRRRIDHDLRGHIHPGLLEAG